MEEKIRKLNKFDFPSQFSEIPQPPKKLYILGQTPDWQNENFLCVVGSRKFSSYGKQACQKIIEGLSGYPITIVSGLAIGIDSIAHKTALDNNLKTIAFPGSGLSEKSLYPKTNINLAREIIDKGGALISEFDNETPGYPSNFPQRNRLMAGLCKAILVVEAQEKSGTMITARMATDYNKDVCTIPGSIFSDLSTGSNKLLKLGATPITQSADILDLFDIKEENKNQEILKLDNLSNEERDILNILKEPLSKDEIIEKLKKPINELSSTLTLLEIKDLIRENLGKISRNF